MKQFSEATRVQMPAMVHLTRIGYTYFGKLSEDKNGTVYDSDTNILLQVFERQFKNLNPGHEGEFLQVLKDIRKELNDDDLGRGFYNRLKAVSPVKLIDFDNIGNNTFHFTAEFTCKNGQDEFRPDITLFVNGLPLCFVEVKKPNNHGGMLAESARMNKERFPNKKFRRFINITQSAKKCVFCGEFSAVGFDAVVEQGQLIIQQEGKVAEIEAEQFLPGDAG